MEFSSDFVLIDGERKLITFIIKPIQCILSYVGELASPPMVRDESRIKLHP